MFISKKCPYCKGKLGAKEVPIKEGRCCHCEQPILYKLNIKYNKMDTTVHAHLYC